MPVTETGKMICDGCGKDIDEQLGGYQCPVCQGLYCTECEPDYPFHNVEVDPHAKRKSDQFQDMCEKCYRTWLQGTKKMGVKTIETKLDGYFQTQTS